MIQSTCPRRNKLVLGKFKFGEFLRITNFEEMKWIGVNLEIKGRMRGKNIGSVPNVDRFSTRKTLIQRRRTFSSKQILQKKLTIYLKGGVRVKILDQIRMLGSHLNKENFVLRKEKKILPLCSLCSLNRIRSKYGFVSSNKIKFKIWSWLFSPKIIFYERKRHSLSD